MEHEFNYLKDLFVKDPEEFKKVTDKMISDFIDSVPPEKQKKLERKQWRLDHELGKIKNPLARMNKMVNIFWEGVNEFRDVTSKLTMEDVLPEEKPDTNVVDFKKKD